MCRSFLFAAEIISPLDKIPLVFFRTTRYTKQDKWIMRGTRGASRINQGAIPWREGHCV